METIQTQNTATCWGLKGGVKPSGLTLVPYHTAVKKKQGTVSCRERRQPSLRRVRAFLRCGGEAVF